MSRRRFAVLAVFVPAALLASCDSGTQPDWMDDSGYCGAGGIGRAHRAIYDAEGNRIRYQTFGSDGKMFYEYTYQYAGGRLVAEIGRGIPPGPGRPNMETRYTFEELGNRLRVRTDFNGEISCRESVRDTAAHVIRTYPCDSDRLLSIGIQDSLGRPSSDSTFSDSGTVVAFTTTAYDDSGKVSKRFKLVEGAWVPDWTLAYGAQDRLRYEMLTDAKGSVWKTATYSRSGSLETFESFNGDGTRLERGFSELTPTGKTLRTIHCATP